MEWPSIEGGYLVIPIGGDYATIPLWFVACFLVSCAATAVVAVLAFVYGMPKVSRSREKK